MSHSYEKDLVKGLLKASDIQYTRAYKLNTSRQVYVLFAFNRAPNFVTPIIHIRTLGPLLAFSLACVKLVSNA